MAAPFRLSRYFCILQRSHLVTPYGFNQFGIRHNSDGPQDKPPTSNQTTGSHKFDVRMLEHLACPLSKEPLRYDEEAQELICDYLGVAYPIHNGIPNFIPTDARKLPSQK